MKTAKLIGIAALIIGSMCLSNAASAHDRRHWGHRHFGVGVYLGPGPVWPWYAYPPRYYYPSPPVVVVPAQPPVYIERGEVPAPVVIQPPSAPTQVPSTAAAPPPPVTPAPAAESYWYYCSDPQGYYPYVKSCPLGWQKVAPAVPPQ